MSLGTPLSFPADVFARLEPDIYLQRHLELDLRPAGLRKFLEFRPIQTQLGSSLVHNTLGSSVVRVGGTTAVCDISGGITETLGGAGIYPNVEIIRGSRNGPPTQEEMVISQRVYQLLRSGMVDESNFVIAETQDKWLVLNVHIQVLSRSGPCFDIVWNAVVLALRNTRIPSMEIDPDTNEVICDKTTSKPIQGSLDVCSSTFGVGELHKEHSTVLLADVEGDTEEACVTSRINVVCDENGLMRGLTIGVTASNAVGQNRGVNITREHIETVLKAARGRTRELA
jgi:exosome complex component RRP43